jgi:putative acetyltransferase
MPPTVTIRPEVKTDRALIGDVITRAFRGKPYADGDEAELVDALREQGALAVSLVAEVDGVVVGQVAFSPAISRDGLHQWFALGPLAVLPAHQRQGIGHSLVAAGLHELKRLGAEGCILVGNPAYYARVGFNVSPSNAPDGQPREYFMVLSFGRQAPEGPIDFHPAFGGG